MPGQCRGDSQAGHGGKDPGSLGDTHYEKDIALAVSLQLKRIINENLPEIKVVLTREDDQFIELHQRGEIAKKIIEVARSGFTAMEK